MVRSNGLYIDQKAGTRTRICSKPHEETEDILEPLLLVHTYGCCGCYMITRNLLLECYPDLDIYESRVGQNWQLLVPAASRSKCGYIDQDLYWVYVHEDSHSRKKRSYQQEYERWDAFTEVLLHAIEVSQCNQTACAQLVLENCARQKFYYAIAEKNKAVMRETFRVLQKNGSVTWKERMLYYKKQLL